MRLAGVVIGVPQMRKTVRDALQVQVFGLVVQMPVEMPASYLEAPEFEAWPLF